MSWKIMCTVTTAEKPEGKVTNTEVNEDGPFKTYDQAYGYLFQNYDMQDMYESEESWYSDWIGVGSGVKGVTVYQKSTLSIDSD